MTTTQRSASLLPGIACSVVVLAGIHLPIYSEASTSLCKATPSYAVTTSWLECCLRNVAGEDANVVRLCPPGSCPGHFDLNPGALSDLRKCRMLFLFDFQKGLEEKVGGLPGSRLVVAPVKAPEGLCVPDSYLEGCRAVHDALVTAQPDKKAAFDFALERVRVRMADLDLILRKEVNASGASGVRAVTSGRQAAFCRWLGLDVVATYSGGEAASPVQLESLIKLGKKAEVRLVVANLQEGRQIGETIAGQLGARLVVFSNFPSMAENQSSFDALLRDNVAQLVRTVCGQP